MKAHTFCNGHYFALPDKLNAIIFDKLEHLRSLVQLSQIIPFNTKYASSDFLVTIQKSNSIAATLYLTTVDGKPISVFCIDDEIYQIKCRFDVSLYNETVFIGYLHENNNNRWIYYVTDIMYKCNHCVYDSVKFINRLKMISDLLRNQYKTDCYMSCCDVKIAGYFIYNHIPLIKQNCSIILQSNENPSTRYKVDLIVNPNLTKVNEIKLWVVSKTKTQDVYHLYENIPDAHNSHKKHAGVLTVTSNTMSKYLRNLFASTKHQLLKCYFDEYFENWMLCNNF